jgi:UPF0176 protein
MSPSYEILLFYKYTPVQDPQALAKEQEKLAKSLSLKGRFIVAHEGINVTLEGLKENTDKYVDYMRSQPHFADIHFKRSPGKGDLFPKLSVKVRPEIVSSHLGTSDVNPREVTGKYLSAEELHAWIHSDKEFYIVDMRNDYEHKVGFFKNSILPPLKNFRDLPQILPKLNHLRNKTVVTVCTGGVRCEKASGFLVQSGFKDVYQLYGGIVTYMETYPNEDFKGMLYVFDGRVTMGFNIDDPKHEIVGKCEWCKKPTEKYIDCSYIQCRGKRHILCCPECTTGKGKGFCSWKCRLVDEVKKFLKK